MKNNGTIKYYIHFILSILLIIVISICSILAIKMLTAGKMILGILCAIAALVCAILTKKMYQLRIESRAEMEANNKNKTCSHLSKEDKKKIDLQKIAQEELIISDSELRNATHSGSESPQEDLNSLVGLANVKAVVAKISAELEFEKNFAKNVKENKSKKTSRRQHMCFFGSAGTGKTTVARIMTGILYKNRCIQRNRYVEVDAAFLKGTSSEITINRIRRVIIHARGGVLFIDEAYALGYGGESAEVIAEIVKLMEDEKDNLCIILAGYKTDIMRFIERNEGLKSRITQYIEFEDFNEIELREILTKTANNEGFCVEDSAYEAFDKVMAIKRKEKNFGNARTVQNIVQEAITNHKYEVVSGRCTPENTYMLTFRDFAKCIKTNK